MTTKVAFVVAIGRLSTGNETALPKVQAIASQYGGKVTGGVGSSTDPIIAEFGDSAQAAKAAQQAFYLDDIEYANIVGNGGVGEISANEPGGEVQNRGPSQYPLNYGIKEAVNAVVEGKPVAEAVTALLSEKPPVEESAEEITEAKNRWGHSLKKGTKVKVAHPRGGVEDDEIEGFDKPDEYSKAYGKQVRLKSGKTCGIDDCIPA